MLDRGFRIAAALVVGLAVGGAPLLAGDADGREVLLRRAAGVPLDAVVELVLEAADEGAAAQHLPAAGRQRIALPPELAGRIGCRGAGFWCPWQTAGADGTAIVLPVFRVGSARGRIVLTREGAPDRVLVEGTIALPGSPDIRFEREVAVGEDGEIVFDAPQGELDLRFATDGWAPIYRWGIEVEDETAQLGPLRFTRGSSVSGYLEDRSAELPIAGATVAALPASADELGENARRRLQALAIGTTTNDRGFFQLAGLAPGRYRLEIALAGFFPAEPPLVEVVEDSESRLAEPIALVPAMRLTVFVDPPRPPRGAGWKLELVQQDGPIIVEAVADERGAVELERLMPGPYRLEVSSDQHPGVWNEELELSSDRVVTVELPLAELVGTVSLGGEPLIAGIEIGTGARDRWRYRSDDEGRFGGVLRHPAFDILYVHIQADDPPLSKRLQIRGLESSDAVVVESDGAVVELDLALEDRTIDGTVVDGVGNPVADAEVTVYAGDRRIAETTTDDDGEFALRALDGDRYRLHAWRRGRGSSEVVEADLASTDHAGPFRLTLVGQRRVDGVLRTADGRPVQGARIESYTWQPVPFADVGRTDLAGRFWIDVPEEAGRAHLEISAPSLGVIAVCASVPSPEDDIEVVLPSTADATVLVELENDPDLPPAWIDPLVLLRRGGGFLRYSTLRSWSREDSGVPNDPMVVGGLFAGEYALAWLDGPYWYQAAAACEPALGPQPRWLPVGPGISLNLRYDVTPHQRAAGKTATR